MVRIRLKRVGAKRQPAYRVVVADARAPRDGAFIEEIGYYHPRSDAQPVRVDVDRARLWLGRGAQPSRTARDVLRKAGVFEGDRGA
ncbi:MAG: 30S ribosomal protein S16 [Firmicutes bacterium]|nr:30S ribosomal protein S16 [Bacillota bacterium]